MYNKISIRIIPNSTNHAPCEYADQRNSISSIVDFYPSIKAQNGALESVTAKRSYENERLALKSRKHGQIAELDKQNPWIIVVEIHLFRMPVSACELIPSQAGACISPVIYMQHETPAARVYVRTCARFRHYDSVTKESSQPPEEISRLYYFPSRLRQSVLPAGPNSPLCRVFGLEYESASIASETGNQ